jgi:probable HAF family extracellular repeat protein
MSHWKSFGLAIFVAVGLLGEATEPARALTCGFSHFCATEWSGGAVINLGGLPGTVDSQAIGINDSGEAVGDSFVGGTVVATEWRGGSVINLGGVSGSTGSVALGISNAGNAVGYSTVGGVETATKWSGGSVINLGISGSYASGINDAGQIAGGALDGAPIEWSGGSIIHLGYPAGSSFSSVSGINNAGQIVGWSEYTDSLETTVWSDGTAITLGALPGANANQPLAINDAGLVVGFSGPVNSVPEPSTWAMMLLGFAVLGYAGYRRSARILGQNARL